MPPMMPLLRHAVTAAPLILLGAAMPWLVGETNFSSRWMIRIAGPCLIVSALLCWIWRNPPDVIAVAERIRTASSRISLWGWAVVAVAAGWLIGGAWLDGFPIIGDVYAVLMQAKTFALGQLTVPAPPVPEAFSQHRFVVAHGVWISQYPPGWALLLTPLAWLGLPFWLAPAVFGAGILILFWRIARRRLDPTLAAFAVLTLAGSAFFVLNASTLFPHAPAAFFGLAAVEAVLRKREGGGWVCASIAGVMLGVMGLIRPFNAVIFIAVLGGVLLLDWARSREWRDVSALAAFALGGLPFALGLMGYHYLITGSPFTMIPTWLGGYEPLGTFGSRTIFLTLYRFGNLGLTSSPVLALAGTLAPVLLLLRRRLEFTDLLFPATVIAFLFYGGTGGPPLSYGPRYYFEAFPLLVLSFAVGISVLDPQRRALKAVLAVHLIVQISGLASWLVFERLATRGLSEPFRLAEAANLENALVIMETCPSSYRRCVLKDMTYNGLEVTTPPVVYALDLGDGGARLKAAFPDRDLWIYRDGALTPIASSNP